MHVFHTNRLAAEFRVFASGRRLFSVALIFAPAVVGAQAPVVPHVRVEIVVTPERSESDRTKVPAATDVLEYGEIHTLPALSASELVAELPSFSVLFPVASGLLPIVSSRGFFGGGEADYVQLRVDGVPIADVETGLTDWPAFSTSDIARIETLRGPGSSLYGDTAL
jgi:outer membrane cobalamin receptor